ncbi:MAG: arylesterase [Alphaproteobacteria bacterium]|nr:arylesterase [Alphaproteobacteria bacterium]|tara:strand:- start:263 stop:964 length:702 start_codon:yes stop_codon:yes gene_type:complete
MWEQLLNSGKRLVAPSRRARLYHIGRVSIFAIFVAIVGVGVAATSATAERELVVVAFGDSLTAGYGLPASDAFPVRLETALRKAGVRVRVINSGVSGETTAGGRARLDWVLSDMPDAVIVELGANDALRGIDPAEAAGNLNAILEKLKKRNVRVLLAGMLAPPNLGERYAKTFNSIYPDLAAAHDVMLYPFFLDGVAAEPHLNQPDGMHPNADGVAAIVERIGPYVKRLLNSE